MVKLHIKKFDITSIADDKVIVAIGKRGSGKTFVIKDLLYYHRGIPVGTLISGTESANRTYSDHIPSIFIHQECSPEILDKVLKRQKVMMKKLNKEIQDYGKTSLDPRAFLILDDCLHDATTWSKNKNIKYVFFNGRHLKMFSIITMQYPLGIPPMLRTNIDYVFIMRENDYSNRKRLYEAYCGMFPTFDVFCHVLDECTENYECLVIDKTVQSNKLQDQVFWYRAEDHGDFLMCCKSAWDLHNENKLNQDSGGGSDDEMFSPERFLNKKGLGNFTVHKTH